jgi:hypothetical protein
VPIESALYVDGLSTANPPGSDPRSQADNHFRLIKSVLKATFPGFAGRIGRVAGRTSAYAPTSLDNFTVQIVTAPGGVTFNLPTCSAMGNGYVLFVYARNGPATIAPSGGDEINLVNASQTIEQGYWCMLACSGTSWQLLRPPLPPAPPAPPWSNSVSLQEDAGDPTKELNFTYGSVPTATVRSLALPRANGEIALSGVQQGQCRLALDGADLRLSRHEGRWVIIQGVAYEIPSPGPTLSPLALTPGTLYYIYVAFSGGALVLEASTTGHEQGSSGWRTKIGDESRLLVGMVRPAAGPAFQDDDNGRLVASYYNRRPKRVREYRGPGESTGTYVAWTEWTAFTRKYYLTWAEAPVRLAVSGRVDIPFGSSYMYLANSPDAAALTSTDDDLYVYLESAVPNNLSRAVAWRTLSEGAHFQTAMITNLGAAQYGHKNLTTEVLV